MKYAGIIFNDFASAPGVSLTFFTQGCSKHCEGCHNPETWDFNGGKEFNDNVLDSIISGLNKNNIFRNLCIQGGEPLNGENKSLTRLIIESVKEKYSDIKIYIWTGFYLRELDKDDSDIKYILDNTYCIIDGPFEKDKRDISLFMRGSHNQNIFYGGAIH